MATNTGEHAEKTLKTANLRPKGLATIDGGTRRQRNPSILDPRVGHKDCPARREGKTPKTEKL